jgi:hypothetical protein
MPSGHRGQADLARVSGKGTSAATSSGPALPPMRAEGLEPTRSVEHRDLNPACLPIPARPRGAKSTNLESGITAAVSKLVNETVSNTVARKGLWVRVPPAASGSSSEGLWVLVPPAASEPSSEGLSVRTRPAASGPSSDPISPGEAAIS